MDAIYGSILELIMEVVIFFVLVTVGTFVYNKVMARFGESLSLREALPEDEIHTLKQVFYLIVMSLVFVDILYSVTLTSLILEIPNLIPL